uniref:Secondary thiamine-phosphate synthase enzyme n=1 Tax=Eutreptiella gymnastica TaxID=73025 RepID=A0A7S1IA51_9EUGL
MALQRRSSPFTEVEPLAMASVRGQKPMTVSVCEYIELDIPSPSEGAPAQEIHVTDLMPHLNRVLETSGVQQGYFNLLSLHTTTGLTINENERRLAEDIKGWLLKLAPPDDRSENGIPGAGVRYLHNDIDQRPDSKAERDRCLENGWDINDPQVLEAWRAQEPINAHAHLCAMLLGSSETIPIVGGRMVIGQWQSVMLVDVDGPRKRKVGVQIVGFG